MVHPATCRAAPWARSLGFRAAAHSQRRLGRRHRLPARWAPPGASMSALASHPVAALEEDDHDEVDEEVHNDRDVAIKGVWRPPQTFKGGMRRQRGVAGALASCATLGSQPRHPVAPTGCLCCCHHCSFPEPWLPVPHRGHGQDAAGAGSAVQTGHHPPRQCRDLPAHGPLQLPPGGAEGRGGQAGRQQMPTGQQMALGSSGAMQWGQGSRRHSSPELL